MGPNLIWRRHLKRLGNRHGKKTVKQTEGDVWGCRGRQPFANQRGASEGAKPIDSSILDCQPPDPWEKAQICCLSLLVSGTFLLAWGDLMKLRKGHVFFFNYFVLRFFRKKTMSEGIVVNVYDLHMWISMDSPSADTRWGSGAWPQEWGRFACFYPVMTVWWAQGLGASASQTMVIIFKRFLSGVGCTMPWDIHKVEYSVAIKMKKS